MRLFRRRDESRGGQSSETPEETLARLNAVSSAEATSKHKGEQVPESRFTVIHKRNAGYAMAEVDAFIDTIDQRSAEEIQRVLFRTAGGRDGGYDMNEVDRFLDEQVIRRQAIPQVPPPQDSSQG